MILDRQLDVPPSESGVTIRPQSRMPAAPSLRPVAVFLFFFAVVVALQIASGAYHAEFSGYPDEPAHYVTSLMVHNYITDLKAVPPLQFAWNFYHHYPKVAFGHWPPVFYAVQAVWMTLFSSSRASIRLELALTTALLAYAVYTEARRWFGWKAAVIAGALTVCLPLVQTYTDEEMSETLLTLLCFWSAIYFIRYLQSERWQDNLGFGIFFSLAVLTKGNGWLLAFIPPVALLLTRKLRLVMRPRFWISALLIALSCLPWQLMTMQVAERGWAASKPSLSYTWSALGQFLLIFIAIPGPVLSALIAIGIVVTVLAPMLRKPVAARPAVMLALILAVWIFHSLVPAGVEDRKLLIAVPALILFLFAGGIWVADRLPLGNPLARWRRALIAIAAAVVFSFQTFAIPQVRHYGYTEAARFITSIPSSRAATILVSSESGGEGLLVSEIAMDEPHPSRTIIRGTKALADVDWNVSEYRSLFSNPAEVMNYLDQQNVNLVVLDTFAPQTHFLHDRLLKETVQQSARMHLIATFPRASSPATGQIQIFQRDDAHKSGNSRLRLPG